MALIAVFSTTPSMEAFLNICHENIKENSTEKLTYIAINITKAVGYMFLLVITINPIFMAKQFLACLLAFIVIEHLYEFTLDFFDSRTHNQRIENIVTTNFIKISTCVISSTLMVFFILSEEKKPNSTHTFFTNILMSVDIMSSLVSNSVTPGSFFLLYYLTYFILFLFLTWLCYLFYSNSNIMILVHASVFLLLTLFNLFNVCKRTPRDSKPNHVSILGYISFLFIITGVISFFFSFENFNVNVNVKNKLITPTIIEAIMRRFKIPS